MRLVSFIHCFFFFLVSSTFNCIFKLPSPVLYTTFSTRGSFQFAINANYLNGSFQCCPKPLFQSEAKCKAIDVKCICYFHANETHFLKNGGNSIRIHVVIYDDAKFFHELFLLALFYVAKKS